MKPVEDDFLFTTPDGAILKGWSQGTGSTTLLLVSGLGGTAGFWKEISAALSDKLRVLRFDQRGIGGSSRGESPCTIDQLARDCVTLLDTAGVERCVLLGHSTGGCIGQALARIAPDRLSGLILSATWMKSSRYMRELFSVRREMLDAMPTAYAVSSTLLAYPPAWLEANWTVLERAVANAPATPEALRIVRERIDALLAFDGRAETPLITLPTLVLGARDDMIVPVFHQEELSKNLQNARTILLDDGGHFFPVSRPGFFSAKVVEWINSL